nr:PREDICTED: uncharacterized protein LOC109037652 [Bemisia tabaci]
MDCATKFVVGEAPESDDEEGYYKVDVEKVAAPSSNVVVGEAPESDDESSTSAIKPSGSSLSCLPAINIAPSNTELKQSFIIPYKYDTFLHKKLRSDNEAVFRSISDFVNKTFGSAIKQLNTANQDLLQAQIQLQEAVTCLKQVANNSSQVKSKIDSILSTPFLPNIKIQVPPALPIDSELLK